MLYDIYWKIKHMKKLITSLFLLPLLTLALHAQMYLVATFNPSTSETNHTGGTYGLYASPTNANANSFYVGFCNQGSTNIVFSSQEASDVHTLTINPVYLYITYSAGTNTSPYSAPFLFDTNNYPTAPNNTPTNPIVIPIGLVPPTGINVLRTK
jgi:hypothetical protein